jgi:hypothetical protein
MAMARSWLQDMGFFINAVCSAIWIGIYSMGQLYVLQCTYMIHWSVVFSWAQTVQSHEASARAAREETDSFAQVVWTGRLRGNVGSSFARFQVQVNGSAYGPNSREGTILPALNGSLKTRDRFYFFEWSPPNWLIFYLTHIRTFWHFF